MASGRLGPSYSALSHRQPITRSHKDTVRATDDCQAAKSEVSFDSQYVITARDGCPALASARNGNWLLDRHITGEPACGYNNGITSACRRDSGCERLLVLRDPYYLGRALLTNTVQ